ncbi:MAG TPA: cupredoxin family copper-binding protein [Gemmatimonadales bacterium]|nr:cupredoxin family copper-binding protein [Gemmatimonadales bacterium]
MIWQLAVLLFAAFGGSAAPRTHTVEIRGMQFRPAALTVAVGDTVVWINRDIVPHTATATGKWDTGTIAQGASGRLVAARPGALDYICTLHPTMRGTLIIRKQHS